MNPDALSAALLAVVAPLAEARRPGAAEGLTPADLPLERPKNRDHGDWASNAALKLAKAVGVNPRELAGEIAAGLRERDVEMVGRADVHDVDVGGLDQPLGGVVGELGPEGIGRAPAVRGSGRGDPDKARTCEPGGPRMDGTDEPGPSNGNA